MRIRAVFSFSRVASVVFATVPLIIGPVGCGGDSGSSGPSPTQPPPEISTANQNMENFMKNQAQTKKK